MRPIYAPMVMASGIQGEVVVEATVDTRGKVAMLRVVRTLPMLTQATIDAVRQWEFDPTTMSGAPVVVTVTASFTPPRYSRSASTGSTRVRSARGDSTRQRRRRRARTRPWRRQSGPSVLRRTIRIEHRA